MKLLLFSEFSTIYDNFDHNYNGCGWAESLQVLIEKDEKIDLNVAFFTDSDKPIKKINNTTYVPLKKKTHNNFNKLVNNWLIRDDLLYLEPKIKEAISYVNPDVIHVFGTEGVLSKVGTWTTIPTIYHLQGIVYSCFNSYFPVNTSRLNFLFSKYFFKNNLKGNGPFFNYFRFKSKAEREIQVLKMVKNVMGRTNWDNDSSTLINPDLNYYHVDEVLRSIFYEPKQFNYDLKNDNIKIVSVLSDTPYKGLDVLIKTANFLKNILNFNFSWTIIGVENDSTLFRFFLNQINDGFVIDNIVCVGKKNATELREILYSSDIFVHPSYIENSPNSVCEAQIIGLPVIASNVGGVSSLIDDGVSGFLVPSNGIFEMANRILKLSTNKELRCKLGKKGKLNAVNRHDQKKILNDLTKVYKQLLN